MDRKFDRRWYVYLFWVLFLPASFVLGLFYGVARGEHASLIFAPMLIGILVFGVWGLVGYYFDARALADSDWQPLWYLWALGHLGLSPLVVAPIYLLRRTSKTGLPPRVRGLIP